MKDFTPTQKLLMAFAVFAAVAFAVAMATPAHSSASAPIHQPAGLMTPF